MIISGNYNGCRIFIQDEDGNNVASTTVIEHNKAYMTILVRGILNNVRSDVFVTVLIMSNNGIHEYRGKLRKMLTASSATEIALFQGQLKKESRISKRYVVNTKAVVKSLIINRNHVPLLNPLDISIENLSSSGVLIRTQPNCFNVNSIIELKLNIGNSPTTLYGKVVRLQAVDTHNTEYGCKLISVDN